MGDTRQISRPTTVAELKAALDLLPPNARVATRIDGALVPIMLATDDPYYSNATILTIHAAKGRGE